MTLSVISDSFVGNEPNFTVSLQLTVNTDDGNMDDNTTNNMQEIGFSVESEADISFTSMYVADDSNSSMNNCVLSGTLACM